MWYTASVYFQGAHEGQAPENDLWEERLILLEADEEAQAGAAARQISQQDSVGMCPEFCGKRKAA